MPAPCRPLPPLVFPGGQVDAQKVMRYVQELESAFVATLAAHLPLEQIPQATQGYLSRRDSIENRFRYTIEPKFVERAGDCVLVQNLSDQKGG